MERPIDERVDSPVARKPDGWFRFLEACGAVTPLGESDDPCRVVEVADRLWTLGRRQERTTSSHAAASDDQVISSVARSQPRRPIELIEELRRNYREGIRVVWIADIAVPFELKAIVDRVQRSRLILDNHQADPNDDPEIYLYATWERAAQFILCVSIDFWQSKHTAPPAPVISGGPDGSVDVVWTQGTRTLYMNFPQEPDDVVTFFGIDEANAESRLRGEEPVRHPAEWLAAWLVR